jgi:hypothetical protein
VYVTSESQCNGSDTTNTDTNTDTDTDTDTETDLKCYPIPSLRWTKQVHANSTVIRWLAEHSDVLEIEASFDFKAQLAIKDPNHNTQYLSESNSAARRSNTTTRSTNSIEWNIQFV